MIDKIKSRAKLALGTAQFGMAYGVSNRIGQVAGRELDQIISLSKHSGIKLFDTAPAYGESEKSLSTYITDYKEIQIVTKTPHFQNKVINSRDLAEFRKTFQKSLTNLQVDSVYGLLVHRGADLLRPGANSIWAEMELLKAMGKVSFLGVSVYSPEELSQLLDSYPIDIVQLPLNILDQRFLQCGILNQLGKAGIGVHVRSAFLQGLLLAEPTQLPRYFEPLVPHLQSIRRAAAASGCSILSVALKFGLNLKDVETVLVGVDSVSQLDQILGAVDDSVPEDFDWERCAASELRWINPTLWCLDK